MVDRTHLVIGTPCFGGATSHYYTRSLLRLQDACRERNIGLSYRLLGGDALITRARNTIVSEFMAEPSSTHLLFIDADIGFDPDQVFALLDAGKDVSGAVYPAKGYDWSLIESHARSGRADLDSSALSYVVEFLDETAVMPERGFARVRYIGTGFMLVRRCVFDVLARHYPALQYRALNVAGDAGLAQDCRYAFFDTSIDPNTQVYLSEDYAFCKRWLDVGGEIWANLHSELTHVGPVPFRGRLMSIFDHRDNGT
ncbi:MAG: hypothetical protein J0H82_27680 [Alphaproteobacteria bacterium]|nr:hypothetical protein [Alphaproteobacteria bacterium]